MTIVLDSVDKAILDHQYSRMKTFVREAEEDVAFFTNLGCSKEVIAKLEMLLIRGKGNLAKLESEYQEYLLPIPTI